MAKKNTKAKKVKAVPPLSIGQVVDICSKSLSGVSPEKQIGALSALVRMHGFGEIKP